MQLELTLFIASTAAISVGCLLPARWMPALPNDKLLHFGAFAGLSLLAARIADNNYSFAMWLLGLLVAGWLIECLQNWVPGRQFCWRDLAANAAGIAFAASCTQLLPIR